MSLKGNRFHPQRILREEKLLTQAQLAKRAGIAVRTVVAIETSAYPPRMATRRLILQALGVPHEQHLEIFGPLPSFRRKS